MGAFSYEQLAMSLRQLLLNVLSMRMDECRAAGAVEWLNG